MLSFFGGFFGGIWSALAGLVSGWLKTQEDEQLGADQQKAVDQAQAVQRSDASVKTEAAIAQAETDAPKAQASVVSALDQGKF